MAIEDHQHVPSTHPRRESLRIRELLVQGVHNGITSQHGLIAHGRGEAFDYLLGETTHAFAHIAIETAAAALITARHPVISVNGNTAALAPSEISELSAAIPAPIEVNIFHHSQHRVDTIADHMQRHGAKRLLTPDGDTSISGLDSDRRYVNADGIAIADWILVPLEDGDRCQALRANGKNVIAIDLNPISRTARDASITIVDNVTRAIPLLNQKVQALKQVEHDVLRDILKRYDHRENLAAAENTIRRNIR